MSVNRLGAIHRELCAQRAHSRLEYSDRYSLEVAVPITLLLKAVT